MTVIASTLRFRLVFLEILTGFGIAAAGAPAEAPAADRPAEEMTYTPPAGWEKTEQERITVFSPPGVPPTKCAIIVTPGENLDTDFLKWFRTKWDALRKGGKVIQGGDRTGQDGPNGSSVLYQAALVESEGEGGAKRRTGLLLYAVHIGSAVHWVVFRTDGADLFNRYKKTANQFMAGLRFVETTQENSSDSDAPPIVKPRPKPTAKGRRAPQPS